VLHPVVQDPVTVVIAREQTHVHRLAGSESPRCGAGAGWPICDEVSRILWNGSVGR
jgi:hypothetical protein